MILLASADPDYSIWFYAVLAVIGFITVQYFYSISGDLVRAYREVERKDETRKMDLALVESALEKLGYYHHLSPSGKEKFAGRVKKFIDDKEFIGMNGFALTSEMRIQVSAAAIQLTFGLRDYSLPHFHTIKIYPDEFYSRLLEKRLKGGTTPSGMILLSWRDFVKGNSIPDDKINLGFHEMAHALLLDMLYGDDPNEELQEEIGKWESTGSDEMTKMQHGKESFLRAYGGTNEHEFFAVSVEHFFESPEEFKRRLPDVYAQLCRLLNQDPTHVHGDYVLNTVKGIA